MAKKADFNDLIALFESASPDQNLDQKFCECMVRAFDAELASVLDYNEKFRSLAFRFSMDLGEHQRSKFFIRLGEGVCGVAAYKREAIAVNNPMQVSSAAASIARETGLHVRALLAVPVVRRGRTIAVIEILNPRAGSFSEDDKLLSRLAAALYASRRLDAPPHPPSRGAANPNLPEEAAIIGASPELESALRVALKAARIDLPILILGESGTGKELFARRIHEAGPRAQAPFVAINCAALTENLLESELFGHVRGAFTGATQNRRGRLEEAQRGTAFLDEVGDMSAACQAKLLRTLDRGEVTPVGSNLTRHIDVRFIAATNRPIETMVREGRFRGDLYYRLSGVSLRLPALRERVDDIPLLAEIFMRRATRNAGRELDGIDEDAVRALQRYSWPGNVRELRNRIESIVMLAEEKRITLRDLRDLGEGEEGAAAGDEDEFAGRILAALKQTAFAGSGRWNIAEAARRIGLPRKTLEYQIKKLGLMRSGKQA